MTEGWLATVIVCDIERLEPAGGHVVETDKMRCLDGSYQGKPLSARFLIESKDGYGFTARTVLHGEEASFAAGVDVNPDSVWPERFANPLQGKFGRYSLVIWMPTKYRAGIGTEGSGAATVGGRDVERSGLVIELHVLGTDQSVHRHQMATLGGKRRGPDERAQRGNGYDHIRQQREDKQERDNSTNGHESALLRCGWEGCLWNRQSGALAGHIEERIGSGERLGFQFCGLSEQVFDPFALGLQFGDVVFLDVGGFGQ